MRFGDLAIGRRGPPAELRPPLTRAQRRYLEGVRGVARWMDTRWGIGPVRVGLDTVLGIIPGVGDLAAGLASLYELWAAVQLRVPPAKLARMVAITVADLLIGMMPIAGDAADAVFKSHVRNLRIIEEHVRRLEGADLPSRRR